MNTTRYFEGRVHRYDHRVYGYQLRPLCLLDLVALEAAGSPIGSDPTQITALSLALAARMLSKPHRDDLCIDAAWVDVDDDIAKRLTTYNGPDELKKWFDFWVDHYTPIEVLRPQADDDSKPLGAHWTANIAAFLHTQTNATEREIWTAPIGRIFALHSATVEMISDSRVRTEEDDQRAAVNAQEAEANAKAKLLYIEQLKQQLASATDDTERTRITAKLRKLTSNV